ncbi:MAG: NAD(P)-dependent oxidoreductase [Candidatus Dormibacteraeota bacterium]|nr:NAD(P)-dependent oxidoreductase [Candidatus Dormibacteraeota bacterium]
MTGATGRVGRAVVECARGDGHQVVGVDRTPPTEGNAASGVEYRTIDTTSYDDFLSAVRGADALIHLAAHPSPHGRPDHETFNNNAVSSYNALSIGVQLGMKRICQASSVNAIGTSFSRWPRYDYLPLDEKHPTYAEDPYALSKWVCEAQADSFCRLHSDLAIASMRFSWIVESRAAGIAIRESRGGLDRAVKELWGYTDLAAAARACVDAVAGSSWVGSEAFYLVAPRTMATRPSAELVAAHYPDVALRHSLAGFEGLYDCSKAERLLGWRHPEE